ncbi:MAG: hypothetical protein LBQ12_05130 [Deltaproteobacteria bacterium]|nr:hypothetical protein [Deltaproteobacteria bacterium]
MTPFLIWMELFVSSPPSSTVAAKKPRAVIDLPETSARILLPDAVP